MHLKRECTYPLVDFFLSRLTSYFPLRLLLTYFLLKILEQPNPYLFHITWKLGSSIDYSAQSQVKQEWNSVPDLNSQVIIFS